ncbi:unnamed protein product [Phytophthora lilii]|uniref:Unnamed protein product n=1 Tax=Phytophthora lilii TaxID=2077276 RepID=A0A9W6X5W6_9STRA|nr:unnamed protein product [Phytophthora lilii]
MRSLVAKTADKIDMRDMFRRWKETTDKAGPTFRSQLAAADDQDMADMTLAQRLDFDQFRSNHHGQQART